MPAPQPTTPARRWTREEVRALQDESRAWPRYELIDGELLVTNAPAVPHQRAVTQLVVTLHAYVERYRLGEVLTSPADLELEPGTVNQPDVFVVPTGGGPPRTWADVRALLLAIEVLSPSTGRQDRVIKRRFYQRVGVPEYWVADLDDRLVERWRPGDERAELLDERLAWHPAGAAEPFVFDLPPFFARAHGEPQG